MYATTDNPIDVLLAVVLLAPVILAGVGAALGWVKERTPCDCLHCTQRRQPGSVPPASGIGRRAS